MVATEEGKVARDTLMRIDDEQDIEKQDYIQANWTHKVAFTVLGISDLFYWNCELNILFDIRDKIYPDYPSMTDTLNAVNVFVELAVVGWLVKSGAMNLNVTVASGAGLALSCVLTGICVQWAPGLAGVVILHLVNAIAGSMSGLYQGGGFGLASVFGEGGLTGYVSTGQGITGVITFVLWQVISKSGLDTKAALWVLMACGVVVCLGSCVNFWYLTQQPVVAQRAAQVKRALKDEAINPTAPSYRLILLKTWEPMLCVFWSFYITLFFFPNIGPLGWGEESFSTYNIGCFQVGDLIGRYMPVFLPFTCVGVRTSSIVSAIRTVFLPLAIVCWFKQESVFWGNRVFHMILMALMSISNGWVATCVVMKTPSVLREKDWRSRAMSLVVLCMLAGISAGLWSARVFTAVANAKA